MTIRGFIYGLLGYILLTAGLAVLAFFSDCFPPAQQPKGVIAAARIELGSGLFCMSMAGVMRWLESEWGWLIVGAVGLAWSLLAWHLRRGFRRLRWAFIPFQVLRLIFPIVGWIGTLISTWNLYFNKKSKDYFNADNQREGTLA